MLRTTHVHKYSNTKLISNNVYIMGRSTIPLLLFAIYAFNIIWRKSRRYLTNIWPKIPRKENKETRKSFNPNLIP